MEQENKKRRTGQNIAFYTALAVCLIAVGVGTWELLQPERGGNATAAVSSAVALPGGADAGSADAATVSEGAADVSAEVSADVSGSETSAAQDSGTVADAPKAVSGAAPMPKETAAKADVKATESGGKSNDGAAKTEQSGGKSKNAAKTEQSAAKSKDAAAKNSSESKSDKSGAKSSDSKADAKTDQAKLSGEVVRPVEGETVTGFSMDKLLYNETMRDWRTHDGVDIAAEPGTAVVAARAGTVESVAADPVMGVTVVIRHADKWESVYASLSDMAEVEAGDDVTAGQVIGFVGETAASESALGPHLHFAALNDGVPADPETFLA